MYAVSVVHDRVLMLALICRITVGFPFAKISLFSTFSTSPEIMNVRAVCFSACIILCVCVHECVCTMYVCIHACHA